MSNIIMGLAIIAIGLVQGDSLFYGDFHTWNYILDGAGILVILKGLYDIITAKR